MQVRFGSWAFTILRLLRHNWCDMLNFERMGWPPTARRAMQKLIEAKLVHKYSNGQYVVTDQGRTQLLDAWRRQPVERLHLPSGVLERAKTAGLRRIGDIQDKGVSMLGRLSDRRRISREIVNMNMRGLWLS